MRPQRLEQIDFGLQRIRDLMCAAVRPRTASRLRCVALKCRMRKSRMRSCSIDREPVVFLDVVRAVPRHWKQRQQPRDAGLHQMQTGRLQRFESAAGQAIAVLVPELRRPAGRQALEGAAPTARLPARSGAQGGRRLVIAEVALE